VIEMSDEFIAMARDRFTRDARLFADVAAE